MNWIVSRACRRRETARMIDEAALTKGQLRKLNALRKSVGPSTLTSCPNRRMNLKSGAQPEGVGRPQRLRHKSAGPIQSSPFETDTLYEFQTGQI